MAFVTDKEKLKSGLIIFRRGDVAHNNFYCRIKLPKEDRYKTIALGTADRQSAHDQAFDLDADIRFQIKHDVPVFNRPFRQVAEDIAASATALFDLTRLNALYAEFLEDRKEMNALHKRQRDRKTARAVQRKIAKMAALPKLSRGDRDAFETHFRNLITSGDGHAHLWHSGDIHRRG